MSNYQNYNVCKDGWSANLKRDSFSETIGKEYKQKEDLSLLITNDKNLYYESESLDLKLSNISSMKLLRQLADTKKR